jgi:hypothetical protein
MFTSKANKIDLNKNLENTTFGEKYVGTKTIIVKTEKISDTEVIKDVFGTDGRLISHAHDIILPDGSIKRS